MFSYFVVVSYPHWFKFCQKCDIKFRIHNYHFFHKQNPIVLSNFLWKNHLWSMDCQRGDTFLDVNLGSVPLCITSWSILSFSCGYILICFLWKWEEKNELNVNIRDGSDMMILLLLAKQIDMSEGFFFDEEENEYICTEFRKRMALMWNFWIKTLPATFQLDMTAHFVSNYQFCSGISGGKSM